MSKVLTVFGATGNQGGSTIKRILENPQLSKTYKLRGITRDVSKPAAKALEAKGVEMVSADLNNKESVLAAIKGSSAVFGVTNYWEKQDGPLEVSQGKNIADASKEAGVEHLIWSTLIHVTKQTNGAITSVKHFESKADVGEYIRSLNIPYSFVMPAVFMTVAWGFRKLPDSDVYGLAFPFSESTGIPLIDPAEDMGQFVAAALLDGPKGQHIQAASGYFTAADIVKTYAEVTGRNAKYNEVTPEVFQSFLPPSSAEELTGNFRLIGEYGYYAGEPADGLDQSLALVEKFGLPKPSTLRDYMEKKNKEA